MWRLETGDLRPSKSLAESLAAVFDLPAEAREAFVRFARGEAGSQPFAVSAQPPVAAAPPPVPLRHLPAPMASFVGRKQALAAVCATLRQADVRLLTLTGPPGVGKTRLSLAAADQLAEAALFPDGVFFVSLAPVSEPALVVSAVAQTLGVREPAKGAGEAELPLQPALRAFFAPKRLLLVLDNFEQVTAAAPYLTDWLVAARGLKLLVTSREVLHAYGEHEFPVPPLEVPDIDRLPSPQAKSYFSRYSAIQLFKQRAQAARPDFTLTADNQADVARVCAWLDGLPLAIEMAAAQAKWLQPRQILAQLADRLSALTGGPRDRTPRQQSLTGAIDWSYHLLPADQQRLFARLGIFVGGCTAAAVEAVAGQLEEGMGTADPEARVSLLRSLIEKSLLRYELPANGEARYAQLETLREYALARLGAAGELAQARAAHAGYYLGLAQAAEPHFVAGGDQVRWLRWLEQDHDNLRAAMAWAVEDPARAGLALELGRALYHFWYIRGHLSEGQRWLEAALALDPTPSTLRGHVLNNAGSLAWLRGDYEAARSFHEEASALQKRLGDEAGLCRSLESLAILAATPGDWARAGELLEQTLVRRRRLGDDARMLSTLNNLAMVVVRLKEFGRAERLYHEAVELGRALGGAKMLGHSLHGLGEVQIEMGAYGAALASLQESVALRHALNDRPSLARTLEKIAMVLYHLQDAVGAARLMGAGARLREEVGLAIFPGERSEVEANLALVRAGTGQAVFAHAWAEGLAMPLEDVVAQVSSYHQG